jgi:DNA-binding transcriptional regulator YdaS (Cro superfamily)
MSIISGVAMNLADYLKTSKVTQMEFARNLGVAQGTVGFWLHNKPPTLERAIQIEKATNGQVTCEELRPDVDWAYLRATRCEKAAA